LRSHLPETIQYHGNLYLNRAQPVTVFHVHLYPVIAARKGDISLENGIHISLYDFIGIVCNGEFCCFDFRAIKRCRNIVSKNSLTLKIAVQRNLGSSEGRIVLAA
jgi:hypothetical protein